MRQRSCVKKIAVYQCFDDLVDPLRASDRTRLPVKDYVSFLSMPHRHTGKNVAFCNVSTGTAEEVFRGLPAAST
jgi:hypothetical protein